MLAQAEGRSKLRGLEGREKQRLINKNFILRDQGKKTVELIG